ncbi:MAG TPA: response regulator [Candidatus Limnocylindria bacterium]|nr:response regulator [Candidatus Limnocylindria bacterium]
MHQAHTVLVVDDEPAVREMLEDVLSSEGHEVMTAPDGAAALDALRGGTSRPCMILLDLMMPRMNGWDFAEELRRDEQLRDIPFVIIAANPRFASDAPRLGARSWLGKPLQLDDLLNTVDELCAG